MIPSTSSGPRVLEGSLKLVSSCERLNPCKLSFRQLAFDGRDQAFEPLTGAPKCGIGSGWSSRMQRIAARTTPSGGDLVSSFISLLDPMNDSLSGTFNKASLNVGTAHGFVPLSKFAFQLKGAFRLKSVAEGGSQRDH